MKKLVLIDGNSVLYRAYYATPYLSTSKGTPTNAVYGFINMLLKIIGSIKPNYMLVAFDRKEPTFRHKMYSEYKGTRKPMPDELIPQVDLIKSALKQLDIATYEQPGYEADDIIGTLAKKFDLETIIITGDKDSFQLVDQTTSVYFTKKGITNLEIYDIENFKQKMLIDPIQIIDLKAIMGDSSDNIPGVMGIGEKGAINLIQSHNSVDGIYDNIDKITGKLQEKLINGKESAYMSKTLATININIPMENKSLEDLAFKFPFDKKARQLFNELEFVNFLKKDIFDKTIQDSDAKDQISTELPLNEQKNDIKKVVIDDINALDFKFDKEKYSLIFGDKNIFIGSENVEYVINLKDNFFDKGVIFDDALTFLNPLFESEKTLILYDKKKISTMLYNYGYKLKCKCEDVMLMKYIVDFTQREMNVFELLEYKKQSEKTPASSLINLYDVYLGMLENENCLNLYRQIELPLCDVLFEMEQAGFKMDINTLNDFSVYLKNQIQVIYDKITNLAGCSINLNSPKQLGEILFEKLGLKHGKKTKTGYSTSVEVLEIIEDDHPIIPLILKYRQLSKLLSTYVEGFKPLIDKNTGLVHTIFNQALTTTGRLSSKEPNLQNIPVRDDESKEIRKFFISSFKNGTLVSADYSQIELRLLAHFSQCKPLVNAYNQNEDIHTLTASQVFNVELNQVTDDQRRKAKAVNFGIIYGISEYGLSKNIKTSPKLASEYIKRYFEMYPSVKEYMEDNVKFAKENGYISTMFGRKRVIAEINSSNYNIRSFGERASMNMPLQGTAADIIKIAMINVANEIKRRKLVSKLILQVHDELIVDATSDEVEIVKEILKTQMEGAVKLTVPLTVEVSSGKTWFDAK